MQKFAPQLIAVLFFTVLVCPLYTARADAPSRTQPTRLKGFIGDTDLVYRVVAIAPHASRRFPVARGASTLVIREVFPDTPSQPTYESRLLCAGRVLAERRCVGNGFGPRSYFVGLPPWARGCSSITIENSGKDTLFVQSVVSVTASQLAAVAKSDRFILAGLTPPGSVDPKIGGFDDLSARLLREPKAPGIDLAFSVVLSLSASQVALDRTIALSMDRAKESGLPILPIVSSFWSDTPLLVADGQGGTFGDVTYQQVCWSPEANAYNAALAKMLGATYDAHYFLSAPNTLSNTPWLTLNHPVLNAYRVKMTTAATRSVSSQAKTAGVRLVGMILENEPRYWDTEMDHGWTTAPHQECEADFNPTTVQAAAADGVRLQPGPALTNQARVWLQRNVVRYNAMLAAAAHNGFQTAHVSAPPLYTNILPQQGFPGSPLSHAGLEWAFCRGVDPGIEGFRVLPDEYDRAREWGRWANVNREEGDGRAIDTHLWDLRLTYAYGGRFYNSYNWYVAPDRVFAYFKQFLEAPDTAPDTQPAIAQRSASTLSFTSSLDLKMLNEIDATVPLSTPLPRALIARVRDADGHLLGFARAEGPFRVGSQTVMFRFSEPFSLAPKRDLDVPLTAVLEVTPEAGTTQTVTLSDAKFSLDSRQQRLQSLWIEAHPLQKP